MGLVKNLLELAALSQKGIETWTTPGECTDRGLQDTENGKRHGYGRIFSFNFPRYIGERIDSGIVPFLVLDVGCGSARFPGDLEKMFGDKILCFGISHAPVSPHIAKDRYIVGDAINPWNKDYVMRDIPDGAFNPITSANCFEPNSQGEVLRFLRVAARKLARDSLGLIETPRVYQNTVRILRARGMNIQTRQIPREYEKGYAIQIET